MTCCAAPSVCISMGIRNPALICPAGQNIANPIAPIWAGALMLDYLGEPKAAQRITRAIENILKAAKTKTRDLGGSAKTAEMGDVIADEAIK